MSPQSLKNTHLGDLCSSHWLKSTSMVSVNSLVGKKKNKKKWFLFSSIFNEFHTYMKTCFKGENMLLIFSFNSTHRIGQEDMQAFVFCHIFQNLGLPNGYFPKWSFTYYLHIYLSLICIQYKLLQLFQINISS